MRERKRAAAVIIRDGRILMVHERSHRSGREWWTLPGGGIEPGETPEQAVRREVLEETGLVVEEATYLLDTPYPSGMTTVFAVIVGEGEPVLGVAVDGPEAVGLDWIALPDVATSPGTVPIPPMIVAVPAIVRQRSPT